MQTTIDQVGGLRRRVEITLSYDELSPHFERAYADVQQNLQMRGFRKGKVPLDIIKRRYGEQIERDALSDVATEAFRSAAVEHALDVVGTPVLVEMNRTAERGAHFVIECEVMPEISLVPYETIEVIKPIRTISETDVDEELYNVQLRSAQLEPAEQITDSMYVVKLSFAPIDPQTGAPLVGGKEQEFFLDDDRMDPLLRSELINLRVGDSFVYRTEHAADEHNEEPHQHAYHVTVREIKKVVLPTLDETGEEQLRNEIARSLQEYWEKEIVDYLCERVLDALVEAHDFDVPEGLVRAMAEEFAESTLEKNKDDKRLQQIPREQLIEYFMPQAEHAARWQLIADTILRTEKLELEPERLQRLAERYGVDVSQLRMALEQNPSLRNRLLTDVLLEFLLDRVRIIERPYDELAQSFEDEV